MIAPAIRAGELLVERLLHGGVADVVLSPGSRSAPLALAVAAAERAGLLRLHVRVDERSAGFLGVGLAKTSGLPAAVLCTSGTAVANLLPAVVEARYSGVPLVIVTADRPPEVRGRGASQTIDQAGMLDRFVLGSRDLPVPGDDEWEPRLLEWTDAAVALAARSRGPVHLNAPYRPPLVDSVPEADPPGRLEDRSGNGQPVLSAAPAAPSGREGLEGEAPTLDLPARTVVLAGDLDVWDASTRVAVADLAERNGWPLVWEASSGQAGAPTAIPHGTLLLAAQDARQRLHADAVLTIGPFGLDRGVLAFVRAAGRHVAVRLRPRTDPPDPVRTAEQVVDGLPQVRAAARDDEWLARWRAEAHLTAEAIEATPDGDATVAAVARWVWQAMAPADLLFVASSLAIRQVAAVAAGPGPHVVANRGANGIDGLVSAAWGAAAAWPARTVALLGDLAFLHDHNGLLVPSSEPRPDLCYVVADNNGGGIFAALEQGGPEYAADFDRVFGTPHDRDLLAIARAAGVSVRRVTVAELPKALAGDSGGVRVLVVPVTR